MDAFSSHIAYLVPTSKTHQTYVINRVLILLISVNECFFHFKNANWEFLYYGKMLFENGFIKGEFINFTQ
jgi:hypothetical protein